MRIRAKISTMALLLVLITTASILTVVFVQLNKMQTDVERELFAIEIADAKSVVHNTALLITALQTEVEQRLQYNLKAAYSLLQSVGSLHLTDNNRQWHCVNQLSLATQQVLLPELTLAGVTNDVLARQSSTDVFIDNLAKITGVTCSLFQRINTSGDMLRISTTVPTTQGNSAVGTFIPAIHPDGLSDPVITKVLSGDIFLGRAYVVNDWYNTAYMPLYNDTKDYIIGMLYVGERQSDLVALIKTIEKMVAGNNGNIFMLEHRGGSKNYSLVSTNGGGNKCKPNDMCQLLSKAAIDKSGEVQILHDNRQVDNNINDVIIAYSYFPAWDWIVGISFEHKKDGPSYTHLESVLHNTFFLVCVAALICICLAIVLAYRIAAGISRPLEHAVVAFNNVGRGDFACELDETRSCELTQLYRSFNGMLRNLQQVTASRDVLDKEVGARVTAEHKLQHLVDTLETIISAAPMAIIVLSPEGKVTLWNPAAERIFGWQEADIIGRAYPLANGEFADEFSTILDLVANGIIIQAKEARRYHKDGHRIDLLLSAAPMEDKSVIVIHENISDLKKIQQKLEGSEEQYRLLSAEFKAILDSIQDVISVIGPDKKIIWCNHSEQRWGINDENLSLSYCNWNQECKKCDNCPVMDCFADGQVHSAKITTSEGAVWGVKAYPQFDKTGVVSNVIEVASDITESINLRDEALRSARLASLGELSTGIAHEINNPNGMIMLSAPILLEVMQAVVPILDEYAVENGDFQLGRMAYSRIKSNLCNLPERIIDSSQRIKYIVDDLKDFVRDEGMQQSVDLNNALKVAIRLTSSTVKKSTNNLIVTYAEQLPFFHGSEQRIEQVIVNLIMNACQALPDMNAAIEISTNYNTAKNVIELIVADHGCGIKDDDLAKVVNPFFTTKREVGGTGLGLSISSRIIKEHNGSLAIESVVNYGTTVTITLPAIEKVI